MTTAELDMARVEEQAGRVFGYLGGTMVSLGIRLGDQLGLYKAMAGAGTLSSEALAGKTNLNERWVREWLAHQASAGLVDYHGNTDFSLSDETALVLADESTPASGIGMFGFIDEAIKVANDLPDCFRTGLGRKYDEHGANMAAAMNRATAPMTGVFADIALPALDGVEAKLRAGGKAADIGCGSGGRLIALAERYPRSEFHGYDISDHMLKLGRENVAAAGVTNVTLHNATDDPIPGDASFDFAWFGDVVHDLAHPVPVLASVRQSLKDDGTVLVVDVAAGETLADNIANPMAPLFYGFSQLVCMSSSLSEEGGVGTGTLGLSASTLKSMAEQAGFTRFRKTNVEDAMNSYYEIRP